MAKSNVADILAAQRAVQALDKKGRLAILNDLLKQDLGPKGRPLVTCVENDGGRMNVATYEKGVEK